MQQKILLGTAVCLIVVFNVQRTVLTIFSNCFNRLFESLFITKIMRSAVLFAFFFVSATLFKAEQVNFPQWAVDRLGSSLISGACLNSALATHLFILTFIFCEITQTKTNPSASCVQRIKMVLMLEVWRPFRVWITVVSLSSSQHGGNC